MARRLRPPRGPGQGLQKLRLLPRRPEKDAGLVMEGSIAIGRKSIPCDRATDGRAGMAHHNGVMTRRGLILFASLGIAWGIPYLSSRSRCASSSPRWSCSRGQARGDPAAAARVLPQEVAPVLRRWKPMLAYTIVEIILPWYFLSSAEQKPPVRPPACCSPRCRSPVSPSRARWASPSGCRAWNWLGIVLGMLGVARPRRVRLAGSDLIAVAEMAVVVVGYALGPAILARWMSDLPGVGVVAVSLAAPRSCTSRSCCSPVRCPRAWPSRRSIVSIIVLAVVCSALAFLLMVALVSEIGPVKVDRHHLRQPGRRDPRRRPRCSANGSPSGRSSDSRSCSPARTW